MEVWLPANSLGVDGELAVVAPGSDNVLAGEPMLSGLGAREPYARIAKAILWMSVSPNKTMAKPYVRISRSDSRPFDTTGVDGELAVVAPGSDNVLAGEPMLSGLGAREPYVRISRSDSRPFDTTGADGELVGVAPGSDNVLAGEPMLSGLGAREPEVRIAKRFS